MIIFSGMYNSFSSLYGKNNIHIVAENVKKVEYSKKLKHPIIAPIEINDKRVSQKYWRFFCLYGKARSEPYYLRGIIMNKSKNITVIDHKKYKLLVGKNHLEDSNFYLVADLGKNFYFIDKLGKKIDR